MLRSLWDCCVLGTLGACSDPGGLGCRCRVCFSLARPDRESSRLTPPSVSDPSSLPEPTCLSRNKWWSSAAAWFWLSSSVHLSTASSNRDPNEESLPPSEAAGGRRTRLHSVCSNFITYQEQSATFMISSIRKTWRQLSSSWSRSSLCS